MGIRPLLNEKELLSKIVNGDERAFAELFHWYYKPLGEFVFKLTESLEVAQEIIQDSFIKLWKKRETLSSIENFSGYLYILCRNQAFTAMKKMKSDHISKTAIEHYLTQEVKELSYENPGDHYRALIEGAVAKLPPKQQRVYELSRYDKLKYEEIAKEMNISPETVKKHLQAAVKFIQKDLKDEMNIVVFLVLTTPLVLC